MNKKSKTIVLIGAGSAVFTQGLIADMILDGRDWELRLVDINPENLAVAKGIAERLIAAREAPITVRASTDRKELLPNADFVVTTIAVGGRRAWENDVLIPRKYGIYQPVGDTIMPGGIFRALRMIPQLVAIAQDVAKLAPDAHFFNYSNPMAMNCRGIRKATEVPVIGLCHGVIAVARFLAGLAGSEVGNCSYTAVGINHLTWFLRFETGGKDAFPAVRNKLNELIKEAESNGSYYQNTLSAELFELFDAFPAVLDRHVSEFLPQLLEGEPYTTKLGLERFSFEETIACGNATFESMKKTAAGKKPLQDGIFNRTVGEHEQLLSITASLESEKETLYSVNIPNEGQVENLPRDFILECPAAISRNGVKPVPLGTIPTGCRAMVEKALLVVELAVEAALEKNYKKLIQALVIDGSVKSIRQAKALANEMLKAHEKYLEGW